MADLCKNCGHYLYKEDDGKIMHYNEYQRLQTRIKCWYCPCEKPEWKQE